VRENLGTEKDESSLIRKVEMQESVHMTKQRTWRKSAKLEEEKIVRRETQKIVWISISKKGDDHL